MTEQELRQEFKNHSDCYSDAFEVIQAMTEDAAIAFAKAYADARESKASNKVAEIRRLCKAFLYDLPCSHNVAVIGDFLDAYADNKILDEFKKTVVAAKDTDIAELKAESKYWNDRWEAGNKLQDAAFNSEIENYHEVKRLNAEIKRLRNALTWLKENRSPDRAMIEVFIDKAISPADAVEDAPGMETTTDFKIRNLPQDTTNVLPKNEDQE